MDVRASPPSPAPSVVATSSTTATQIVMKPTLGLALARRSFLTGIIGLREGRRKGCGSWWANAVEADGA